MKTDSSQAPAPLAYPLLHVSRRILLLSAGVAAVLGLWLLLVISRPVVNTSSGAFVVTKARFVASIPPDCTSRDPNCVIARPGYRILLVTLKPSMGGTLESRSAAAMSVDALEVVSVIDADGSRSPTFQVNHNVSPPKVTLAFAVEDMQRGFALAWPNNPAVELNRILFMAP